MAADAPPPVPKNPFEMNWYVQGPTQADGPFTGYVLKDMIAKAQISANTNIAEMGATVWTRLADVPAFAALLPPRALEDHAPAGLEYAGFWIRLLAYVIDVFVLEFFAIAAGIILGIALSIAGILGKFEPPAPGHALPPAFVAVVWIVGLVVTIAYNVYFNSGSWQATPGKRICGIHIIREDGRRVTGLLALGRYLAYIISSLPLGIGFLIVAWTKEKKGLHDMICGTRVVYGKL
jgi:uncharacterized RDD family membrane protein YckC